MTRPGSIFPPQIVRRSVSGARMVGHVDPSRFRRIDVRVLTALALARQPIERAAMRARTRAMPGLDDLNMPDGAPTPADGQQIEIGASLYLAREFEQAGVLRTAELIAGLFASGAINQPLGPTEQLIAAFWKDRAQRLSAAERTQIFDHVFEPSEFYPLMSSLCNALVGEDDDLAQAGDIRARVQLEQAATSLAQWLAPRMLGMAAYAARDIVAALTQATHFMRDRHLQMAFGVQDFWGLLDVVGSGQGAQPGNGHRWVDLGQNGAHVLTWLAHSSSATMSMNPSRPDDQEVIAAAERWSMGWAQAGGAASHDATTTSALVSPPSGLSVSGQPALESSPFGPSLTAGGLQPGL